MCNCLAASRYVCVANCQRFHICVCLLLIFHKLDLYRNWRNWWTVRKLQNTTLENNQKLLKKDENHPFGFFNVRHQFKLLCEYKLKLAQNATRRSNVTIPSQEITITITYCYNLFVVYSSTFLENKHCFNLNVSWSYYGHIMLYNIITNLCSHTQYHNQIIHNLLSTYIS